MKNKITTKGIKKAQWNPRAMGADSKRALKASLLEFQDISGITINEKTKNILAGNHRWEQLCSIYGESNLNFQHAVGDYYRIFSDEIDTGFLARLVNWSLAKEKAANVAANSPLLQGEFTSGLQELLTELSTDFDGLFEELRFDELSIDLGDLSAIGNGGITDPEAASDRIREEAEDRNIMLDNPGEEPGEVKHILGTIKIAVHGDNFDMVRDDIIDFLSNRPYYDDLTIA